MEQGLVDVLPVLLAADHQVGGLFDAFFLLGLLSDSALVLLAVEGFETADHFIADVDGQGFGLFEDEGVGFDLVDCFQGLLAHSSTVRKKRGGVQLFL